jgi:hypothetical protein
MKAYRKKKGKRKVWNERSDAKGKSFPVFRSHHATKFFGHPSTFWAVQKEWMILKA